MNYTSERKFAENPRYPYRLSTKEKRANDSEAARQLMSYYINLSKVSPEAIRKYDENYEIHRGSWSAIEEMAQGTTLVIQKERVNIGGGKLRHYGVQNIVSQSIVGEILSQPLIYIIRDRSSKARNHRETARLERVQAMFQQKFVQPYVEAITQQYMVENELTDLQSLPVEQQAQLQADINKRIKDETPDHILEQLDKFRTPDETLAKTFLDHVVDAQDVKYKFGVGGEHSVVVAEEYYRVGIRNKEPFMEVLNPKWVEWGGSEHVEFVEDGEYAKYTQYLTVQDVISKYGLDLTMKNVKDILSWFSPIPGKDTGSLTEADKNITDLLAANPELQDQNSKHFLDVTTKDGQDRLKGFYQLVGNYHRSNYGIKETYITWKWTRKCKVVTRRINGKEEQFIRGEHYQKNPLRGDIKVEERTIPQVWHGTILGEEETGTFINVEPLPYQYNSIYNPLDVKLSIFGGKINTVMNNAENVSFIDLGKPLQFRYDMLMQKMEEYEKTDIGKVLFATTNLKPEGWTWGQWYQSMFSAKFAPLNSDFEGMTAQDRPPFFIEDLSRTQDIKATIDKLQIIESKIIQAMYYNPAKFGQINQYSTNRNAQLSIQGSDRPMIRFHDRRRKIKLKVLTALLNLTLVAYRDNEYKKSLLLDDFTRLHYELNVEPFNTSEFALFIVDDFAESEKLEKFRELALTIVQNGGTTADIAAIFDADHMGEIKEILEKADKRREEQESIAFERQKELTAQQQQIAEAQVAMDREFTALENERDRQVKIRLAEIDSGVLANAQDINKNQVNDSLEKAVRQIESDEKMQEKDLKFQKYKVDTEVAAKKKAT